MIPFFMVCTYLRGLQVQQSGSNRREGRKHSVFLPKWAGWKLKN